MRNIDYIIYYYYYFEILTELPKCSWIGWSMRLHRINQLLFLLTNELFYYY